MPRHPKNPAPREDIAHGNNGSRDHSGDEATRAEEARPPYEVGYKKPPKRHRFKPGQSGNPRGGKRGPRKPTTAQILEQMGAVFIEPVEAKAGDKVIKLSRIVAATHAILQKAMKADVPAMRVALTILERLQTVPLPSGSDDVAEEAAAAKEIEAYIRHRLSQADELGGQQ